MGVPYESGAFGEYRAYIASLGQSNSLAHNRLLRSLRRALREELTPRQLETVTLFFFQGLRMTEIAQIQGVAVSTVSRSLRRSCRRLEKCLRYGAKELLRQSVETAGAGSASCAGGQKPL